MVRFVAVKFCKRSVNNQITCPPDFEAKIDIGKRFRQAFIQSAYCLKNFATRQHARAGHCAAVAGYLQLAICPRMFPRKITKSRLRDSIDTKNNPGVFNGVVRIQQSRANCANFRPLDMLGHYCQPVALDYFYVTVEEQNPRAKSLFECEILKR